MTAKRKPGPGSAPASLLMPEKLATLVHYLRHDKVILDSDLAELYGVEARVLNQAVKRNIRRFPPDFMFQLNEKEAELARSLRSQTVTLKNPEDIGAPANSSQTVMSLRKADRSRWIDD